MTAKEFLEKMRSLDEHVRVLKLTYRQLKADIKGLKAVDYSKDRITGGKVSDISDLIVRCEAKEEEVKEAIVERLRMKAKAIELIGNVDDQVSCSILLLRYVNNRSWEVIRSYLHYAESQTYYLHRKAVREFTEVYNRSES